MDIGAARLCAEIAAEDEGCMIYDRHNIDQLDRSSISNMSAAQLGYVSAMVRDGVHCFIENVPDDVEYALICYQGCALPFTVSNCAQKVFCVSPKTCWIGYARLLHAKSDGRAWAPVSNFLLGAMGRFARFDRLITLNNYWMTNNPTPRFSGAHMKAFVEHLTARWPDHMIVVKSLPESDPTKVLPVMRALGFNLVKFRFMHFREPGAKRTKNYRADQNLLAKTRYKTSYVKELDEVQAGACAALYQKLYIDKHTDMNTQFTPAWMALARNSGFLDYFMVEEGEAVKAFIISYDDPLGVNAGICGYDQRAPKKDGLYRMLVASLMKKGEDKGCAVNLSTSVARFKELRGTHRVIEYEGVYTRHLSWTTRLGMAVFAFVFNNYMDKIRCA